MLQKRTKRWMWMGYPKPYCYKGHQPYHGKPRGMGFGCCEKRRAPCILVNKSKSSSWLNINGWGGAMSLRFGSYVAKYDWKHVERYLWRILGIILILIRSGSWFFLSSSFFLFFFLMLKFEIVKIRRRRWWHKGGQ